MKTKSIFAAVVLLCSVVSATEFNLAADFSDTDNPNGTWSYGWFLTWIPGNTDLTLLDDNGVDIWSETNSVSIWKNNTGSAVSGVPAGQVGLNSTADEPAVVRWTAPAEIGLAVVRVEGSFTTNSIPGMQIVMNEGVLLVETNTTAFDIEVMVEPGDQLDFFAYYATNSPSIIPLELTISTVKEHLALTTLDDFDGYGAANVNWTRDPAVDGDFYQTTIWSGDNNWSVCASDAYGWGKSEYQDMPFQVSTNTGYVTFRHFSMLGSSYNSSYGMSGIRLLRTDPESASGYSSVLEYGARMYSTEYSTPCIDCWTPTTLHRFAQYLNERTWYEFRADIDFSYVDSEGTYGILNLYYRPEGTQRWIPAGGMTQFELHIEDPSSISRIAGVVNWNYYNGYRPFLDDIRFCDGTNPSLGTDTNLLLNPGFSNGFFAWRTDGDGMSRRATEDGINGTYMRGQAGTAIQICQSVNLLGQGFVADDIDAGLYRVSFGGWQYGKDAGQISVDFLDVDNVWISTASLPSYQGYEWVEQMSTNTIPAGTRSVQYTFTTSDDGYHSSGRLDDAYFAVLGVPQDDVTLTVDSILGSPAPAVGTATNSWNTTVTCLVSNVVDGLTQYECIGWTGTGSVPVSGTSNAVEVVLTDDSSITWLWQTNYWLEVTISGSGSASHSSGWYEAGDVLELIQFPVSGWLFMGWSGDASGTNQVIMTMNTPKTVTATFSEDADGDGLTNTEESNLGSNPWKTDTDGDGFDDKLEADHDWNPAVSDQWAVDHIRSNSDTFDLYASNVVLDVAVGQALFAVAGSNAILQLQLEQSDDLVTWTNAGEAVEWNLPVGGEKQFFRIRSSK